MENVTISFDAYKRVVEVLCKVHVALRGDDLSWLKDSYDLESIEKLLSDF